MVILWYENDKKGGESFEKDYSGYYNQASILREPVSLL